MARRARRSVRKAPPRVSGRATVVLALTILVGLAALALPLCILLIAGMLPSVVAMILDRHRALYLMRTVGAMNLAGIAFPALGLWDAGISMGGLHDVFSNSLSWLAMYGGASLGWLLYLAIPPVASVWVEVQADDLRHRLRARATALVEEWGEEVTGRPRPGQPGGA